MTRLRLLSILFAASFIGATCNHVPAPVGGGVSFSDAGVQTCVTWAEAAPDGGTVRTFRIVEDGGAP